MTAVLAQAHCELTDKQYQELCALVYRLTGIVLTDKKREMVNRRLSRRVRELRLDSVGDYYDVIASGNKEEIDNFVNVITTNLTSFFRENHHFDYLANTFLAAHEREFGHTQRLRIWCSAASTGEEPYSIAISLMRYFGSRINGWDAKILATDIDTNVLATGKQGIYRPDRIEDIDAGTRAKWFSNITEDGKPMVSCADELKQLITFKKLNLMGDWPMKGPFDVIFCRNVLIYFDKPTKEKLLQRFIKLLRPNGLLMLGHSESIARDYSEFECVGQTIYRKR